MSPVMPDTLVVLTARFLNLKRFDQHQYVTTSTQVDESELTTYGATPLAGEQQQQRRLDAHEIEFLASQYVAGKSVRELTESWGIHRTTVLDHLERLDIPRRRNTRKMTDRQVNEAAELYRAGSSLAKLGALFDVDPQTVNRELKRAGITLRPPGRRK